MPLNFGTNLRRMLSVGLILTAVTAQVASQGLPPADPPTVPATAQKPATRISHQLYARTIELAWAAWQRGEIEYAQTLLEETSPALRSWEYDYLRQAFEGSARKLQVVVPELRAGVRYVTFDPKGTRLAACTDHLRLMMWNLDKGKKVMDLHDETRTIDFDPKGHTLISGVSGQVNLRDAKTGKVTRRFRLNSAVAGIPLRVQYSSDGESIAAQDSQRGVRVYDVEMGATRFHLKDHTTPLFRYHPTESRLAVVMNRFDQKISRSKYWISLFDIETGKAVEQITFPLDLLSWPSDLDFSPDGKRLAVSGRSGSDSTVLCLIFDTKTGRVLDKLRGHRRRVTCVRFSTDGTRLATGSDDGAIVLWKTDEGSQLDTLRGHTGPINSIAFHPEDNLLASASADGSIRLWNISPAKDNQRDPMSVSGLTGYAGRIWQLTPDGNLLAYTQRTYDRDRQEFQFQLKGFEVSSGQSLPKIDLKPGTHIPALALSTNQRSLALAIAPYQPNLFGRAKEKEEDAADETSRLIVLNAKTGQEIASFPMDLPPQKICFTADDKELIAIGVRPDRKAMETRLALRGWRIKDGRNLFTAETMIEGRLQLMAIHASPDGKRIVTGGAWDHSNVSDGLLLLFNPKTGQKVATLKETEGYVSDCRFSPDDTALAVAVQGNSSHSHRGRLSVWNLKDQSRTANIAAHKSQIHAVMWTRDGKRIVTAGGNEHRCGEIIFWDAKTLERVWKMDVFSEIIWDIAFNPNGELIGIQKGGEILRFDSQRQRVPEIDE